MPTTIPTTTSSTRPGSPSAGDAYFETDTKSYIIYDGTNWRVYNYDDLQLSSIADTNSLLLDGTDDYLTTSHHFSDIFDGSFSISMWVKTPSSFTVAADTLIGTSYTTGKGYIEFRWIYTTSTTAQLIMYFDESLTGNFADVSEIRTGAVLSNSSWHNIVFTGDRPVSGTATPKIYVDGVSKSLTLAGGAFPLAGGTWDLDVFLGGRGGSSPLPLEGHMDNIALFDKALTENEVGAIYDAGGGGDLSGLNVQHWWKMEEGTGTTVADSGGAATTYTASFNSVPQWSSTVEPN